MTKNVEICSQASLRYSLFVCGLAFPAERYLKLQVRFCFVLRDTFTRIGRLTYPQPCWWVPLQRAGSLWPLPGLDRHHPPDSQHLLGSLQARVSIPLAPWFLHVHGTMQALSFVIKHCLLFCLARVAMCIIYCIGQGQFICQRHCSFWIIYVYHHVRSLQTNRAVSMHPCSTPEMKIWQ